MRQAAKNRCARKWPAGHAVRRLAQLSGRRLSFVDFLTHFAGAYRGKNVISSTKIYMRVAKIRVICQPQMRRIRVTSETQIVPVALAH